IEDGSIVSEHPKELAETFMLLMNIWINPAIFNSTKEELKNKFMFNVTDFTPWTLFTDLGFIFTLILIGKLIRVKVKLIQQLFIPPSLIAGLLGLAFGPNGLGWIPLSNNLGTYAAILIALVFGALPLSSPKISMKEVSGRVGPVWAYAQLGMLIQWALAGLFGLFVLKLIWPNLNDAFGIMLSTGFYGGHGTAAAIGSAFEGLGWDEARSLGMTTATVGVICAIVGGLIMIKWAAKHKQTSFITDFKDLPQELRSGLLPEGKRDSMGTATTSSISIDSLTFHVALVCFVALLGYSASQGVKVFYPALELPVFSCAFIMGLLLKKIFDRTNVSTYICSQTTQRLSSSFTDILVACGVASIKLGVVVKYALQLIVIILAG
ncbi:MAG: sodium/glutamate symporter, partial [Bacteroidales bacterium]